MADTGIAVAITAAAGSFPGGHGISGFWQRVKEAKAAPLKSPGRLHSHRAAQKGGAATGFFAVDDPIEPGTSRLTGYGRAAVAQALRAAFPDGTGRPRRAETALVVAMTGAPRSYFEADAAAYWGYHDDSCATATDLTGQLDLIADHSGIGDVRISVDTACASSLYALDFGVALLRNGSAQAVVVLGINIGIPQFAVAGFERLGALSPDGAILPFAADASGMLLGEAAAAVVLEHADRAARYPGKILATVAGVGLSSDGAERSVFAPGIEGQLRAYERAYRLIDPRSIAYVEAHGTATQIGDATELESLDQFFGPSRQDKLPIGSVKALVGHSLTASGMVSIIKCLYILRSGCAPPHIRIRQHARVRESCLLIPENPVPMQRRPSEPLRVGISSFGFGGSNAHVVLQENVPQPGRRRRTAAAPVRRIQHLQVIDFEAAVGGRIGRAVLARTGWPAAAAPSHRRFATFTGRDLARLGRGVFFPAEFEIPCGSLRAGPRMIAWRDPLQVLASHLTAELMGRQRTWLDSACTAIAISSNLGGEMALRMFRRSRMPADRAGEDPLGGDLQIEHIASGMPSMCSGYPAAAANLRAFHATYGGAERTFLRLLDNAGYWLDQRSHAVIVGGARLIKSAVDFRPGRDESRRRTHCEAIGLFLLADFAANCPAPLADLSFAMLDSHAGAIDQLRTEMSFPEDDASRLVCELSPFCAGGEDSGDAALYLSECAGLDALLMALAGPVGRVGIDFRHGGNTVALAVVSRRADAPPTPALSSGTATTVVGFGAGLRRIPVEPARLAAMNGQMRVRADSQSGFRCADEFLALSAAVVERSLRVGADLVALARAGEPGRRSTNSATAPAHGVPSTAGDDALLADVHGSLHTPHGVSASVRVDPGEPYFFDHPLDHVPAVLLIEAACRLAIHTSTTREPPSRFDVSFPRFCELDAPVTIELWSPVQPDILECRAVQNGHTVLRGRLRADRQPTACVLPAVTTGRPPTEQSAAASVLPSNNRNNCVADPARVHKINPSNVFVNNPRAVGRGRYRCEVVVPGDPHVLLDSSAVFLSPTVLIEAFRQMSTLGAHEMHNFERTRTMTVLSFQCHLDRCLYRAEQIALEMSDGETKKISDVELARLTATVLVNGIGAGYLRSRAFVATSDAYARLRKVPQ